MFLKIPPFPGARLREFKRVGRSEPIDDGEAERRADRVRALRVGGSFWAAQPDLPVRFVLVRSMAAVAQCAATFGRGDPLVLWHPLAKSGVGVAFNRDCDPWHMVSGASAVVIEQDDDVGLIAALSGVPVLIYDPIDRTLRPHQPGVDDALRSSDVFADPFGGGHLDFGQLIELCGFWRQFIDSNRSIAGALGIAIWKQKSVAPLLWSGTSNVDFYRSAPDDIGTKSVAVWRSKAPSKVLEKLKRRDVPLIEVEDGFVRSAGLGVHCVPPLSITVDYSGVHFDPTRSSDLEKLLEHGEFSKELLERASRLRKFIVSEQIGKYGRSTVPAFRLGGAKRHILIPGQVEDDRSVLAGGCGLTSNLELIKRVRASNPDAFLIYKPHPDVLSGLREGAIPDAVCRGQVDLVAVDEGVAALLDMADEVHVNTSLAGFEALLRGKKVATHGVPFYSGWGLTTDLGPVPKRRTARRTIDELVAATLLVYARYLDPVSGLPAPAEVVVRRVGESTRVQATSLPALRRVQGKIRSGIRSLVR